MMFHMLGPTIVARKMANTKAGKASQASANPAGLDVETVTDRGTDNGPKSGTIALDDARTAVRVSGLRPSLVSGQAGATAGFNAPRRIIRRSLRASDVSPQPCSPATAG